MSLSLYSNKVKRLESDLRKNAKDIKINSDKQADTINKMQREIKKLGQAKTDSRIRQIERNISREEEKNKKLVKESSQLLNKKAKIMKDLGSAKFKLSELEMKDRNKKINDMNASYDKSIDKLEASLAKEINEVNQQKFIDKAVDVFVSHSSSDKEDFVDNLVAYMKDSGINVWYDSDSIGWGESIRKGIDNGIKNARFCMVIISKDFMERYWTQYELDSIFQKDATESNNILLPVWHEIAIEDIAEKSHHLTGRKALISSEDSIEDITDMLLKLLNRVE